MNLKEVVTTLACFAVLLILVAVLFVVRDNVFSNEKNENNTNNNEATVLITYNVDGGESLNSSIIKKGDTLVLPTPTKKGYKFLGWYIQDKLVDEYTRFDNNTTIVAKWELVDAKEEKKSDTKESTNKESSSKKQTNTTFKVTFDTKGGKAISPVTVSCNSEPLNLPSDVEREGYTFIGWVDKNNKTVTNGSIIECKDITLYATWEKVAPAPTEEPQKTYQIVFETYGGTEIADKTQICGYQVDLPYPTKEGSLFYSWVDKNENEIVSGMVLPCENIVLFARWAPDYANQPKIYSTSMPVPYQ